MSEVENIANNLREAAAMATDKQARDMLTVSINIIPILMRMVDDLEARSGLQKSQAIGLEMILELLELDRVAR